MQKILPRVQALPSPEAGLPHPHGEGARGKPHSAAAASSGSIQRQSSPIWWRNHVNWRLA